MFNNSLVVLINSFISSSFTRSPSELWESINIISLNPKSSEIFLIFSSTISGISSEPLGDKVKITNGVLLNNIPLAVAFLDFILYTNENSGHFKGKSSEIESKWGQKTHGKFLTHHI